MIKATFQIIKFLIIILCMFLLSSILYFDNKVLAVEFDGIRQYIKHGDKTYFKTLCTKANGKIDYVCNEFIYYIEPDLADGIVYILNDINSQKKYAKNLYREQYYLDQIINIILIVLGIALTISTAFASKFPDFKWFKIPLTMIPVILSAFVSAATSMKAYYKFDEYRTLNYGVAFTLSEIQSEIHFRLLTLSNDQPIEPETVDDWRKRVDAVIQRYWNQETAKAD